MLRSKDRLDPVIVSEASFGLSGHHEELMSAASDPNFVIVEELLANWMAPEVRFWFVAFSTFNILFRLL